MAFSIKRNDTRPILQITLQSNGAALDLTGAQSARLIMKVGSTVVSRTASITNASQGIIQVTFQASDTAVSGNYSCEVEITWAAGQIETVPNDSYFQINVVDDLN